MAALLSWLKAYWRLVVIILVPVLLSPIATTGIEGRCGYVILVMAVYWMTEAIPIPVTSLIPVFAFPLLGVLSTKELTPAYMKETNMLFLGGLTVAVAVEYSNLHKRIALFIIINIGQSPRLLMTGFMFTTMFLSMWISNTATTAMMVPIVDAVLQELYKTRTRNSQEEEEEDPRVAPHHQSKDRIAGSVGDVSMVEFNTNPHQKNAIQSTSTQDEKLEEDETVLFAPPPNEECRKLRDMCYLAIAYSANLGGTGAITGTAPNLVFKSYMDEYFPESKDINFAMWMAYNVPGMIICVFIAWVYLQIMFIGCSKNSSMKNDPERNRNLKNLLKRKMAALGPITFHEIIVLTLFTILVFLWFFRTPGFITGWADLFTMWFGSEITVADSTPAMFIVFLLFIIPKYPIKFGQSLEESEGKKSSEVCLTWKAVSEKIPWGIVLLLGGGFAMAKAADKSKLSQALGEHLRSLDVLPKEGIVFVVSLMTAMATEAASNTATASILLPILKELSINIQINPIYLMLPATICCSYAFMLPVATAPNAIALGASGMRTMTMVKAGFIMNIACVGVAMLMINTLGVAMFDLNNIPPWMNVTSTLNDTILT